MSSSEKLIDDLAALKKPRQAIGKSLDPAKPVSSIGTASGVGRPAGATGGAIASPLTETAYADRVFWPENTLTSSDGFFTLKWKPIKQVKFQDANSEDVILNFQDAP